MYVETLASALPGRSAGRPAGEGESSEVRESKRGAIETLDAHDRLPYPPLEKPAGVTADQVLGHELLSSYRLHVGESSPLLTSYYPSGRLRFDAPRGEYRQSYANSDRYGVFSEIYGDDGRINPEEGEARTLWQVRSGEPLPIIALEDAQVQKCFGLDSRVCTSKQYPATRAWALALYNWFDGACGIRYISRHASPHLNYCLFLDRCEGRLSAKCEGRLNNLPNTVRIACARYKLRSRIGEGA